MLLCCYRTSSELICITDKKEQSSRRRRSLISDESGDLFVSIDKALPTDKSSIQPYTYTPDPTVSAIQPEMGLRDGAIPITVTGTRLTSIQNPQIVLLFDGRKSSFSCGTPKSDVMMTCLQPPYPNEVTQRRNVTVTVTFVMDGVPPSSLQLTKPFSINPNPMFDTFGEKVFNVGETDQIILEGTDLDVVEQKFYKILLGNSKVCNVTNLSPEVSCVGVSC